MFWSVRSKAANRGHSSDVDKIGVRGHPTGPSGGRRAPALSAVRARCGSTADICGNELELLPRRFHYDAVSEGFENRRGAYRGRSEALDRDRERATGRAAVSSAGPVTWSKGRMRSAMKVVGHKFDQSAVRFKGAASWRSMESSPVRHLRSVDSGRSRRACAFSTADQR